MIVDAAREYLGVRFKHQGRDKINGVDCAGLVVCALMDIGITVPDCGDYGETPNPAQMLSIIEKSATEIPRSEATYGDILWIRFSSQPQHLAIVTDIGMIHAYSKRGRVVEHSINDVWKKRIVKCFRLNGECEK